MDNKPKILKMIYRIIKRTASDVFGLFSPIPKISPDLNGKRILIFNWRDMKHRYSGGAERYIFELAKRWVKKHNHVAIFCGNDGFSKSYEIIDDIEIIRHGGFYVVYIWAFLYYVIKFRNRYDIIVDCHNGIPFFTPLYSRKQIYCLMFHVHQEVFYQSLLKPFAILASFLEKKLMPKVYEKIRFLTISQSSRDEIREIGLAKAGISIVYPGIDLGVYKPGRKSPSPLIVYVGRLKNYKSVDILIQSVYIFARKFRKIRIVIAGDGTEKTRLENMTKKLRLNRYVKFLGNITEAEKIKLYQQAWVFVNPSFMEGWGLTTIEANACGTPVVASNVAGLRDSVRNPHTGYLTSYGDPLELAEKIEKIIIDKDIRSFMSHNAVKWAKQFDWDKSAQKSLRILL